MNEKLLQYIWKYQYFNHCGLTTVAQDSLEILFPGLINHDQGPDFLSSKITLNGQVWAGNVEIHVKSSEWKLHGHDNDENYNNVILHVVWINEDSIEQGIPVLELQPLVPVHLLATYEGWMKKGKFIPCEHEISGMDKTMMQSWLHWLTGKRLREKSALYLEKVRACGMNWEEAFWQAIARNFGHRVNADAFARIAASVPVNIMIRHSNNIVQLEALLMGQAGLIRTDNADEYPKMLYREFSFLRKKYGLTKFQEPVHFLRMRPVNFPTVRLAQLAALFYQNGNLFARVCALKNLPGIREIFRVSANDYWHYHYRFGESSPFRVKITGDQMIDNILINTVIPMLHAFDRHRGQDDQLDLLQGWLYQLAAEKNSSISSFANLGVEARHAADTQALLECKRVYCDAFRCMECGIGKYLLRKGASYGQLK